jgi:acetylornithine/N-succinyldiaminopimelate aminotransferase
MPTYQRADVVFERGQGSHVWDITGRRYLDFTSGIAVNALGHAHPYLVEKLTEQAGKLWHVSNLFRVAGQESLAGRLTDATFADTVFFTNSGVEAWECGIKLVRKYHSATGNPQKTRFLVAGGAFHGRTMTAIAASKQDKMVGGFGPLLDAFDQVSFDNLNELRAAITPETAAVLVEPILGEGGIRVPQQGYLKALRETCDEFGLLLYLDEIQTGIGRTGRLFAHEAEGVTPDVMCIAKGIGGGFPLGACLATEKAAQGMVAGNAVLDIVLQPEFLERVASAGRAFKGELGALVRRHPGVFSEARGEGLLLGLKCVGANTDMVTRLRAAGMLVPSAAENVIRIFPPLTATDEDLAEGIAILDKVAAQVESGTPA